MFIVLNYKHDSFERLLYNKKRVCFFFFFLFRATMRAGDYVKLNSPPDSLLEDSDTGFEMREMNRPAPPKTLALNSSTAFNSTADVRSASSVSVSMSAAKTARAASAGRAPAAGGGVHHPQPHHQHQQVVKEYAVYLLGGAERDGSVTVFKKPMAVWKFTMYFRNVQQ